MELQVGVATAPSWSYAYAGTRRSLVYSIEATATGSAFAERDIIPRVTLRFPVPVASVWEGQPRPITGEFRADGTGNSVTWNRVNLEVDYAVLGAINEHMIGTVLVEILDAETRETITSESRSLTLLPANAWMFDANRAETLAAFVLPSDPYVSEILTKARAVLERDTGSASTEGYQSEVPATMDPRPLEERSRVYQIAKAIYRVLSDEPYAYSNPPGNFLEGIQRVRTPSQIKSEAAATCLDSTMLMASCFAQAGLEPVLFLVQGHAFAGYLTGEHLPPNFLKFGQAAVSQVKAIMGASLTKEDAQKVQALLEGGHIQPVETTTTGRGAPEEFHEACQEQNVFTREGLPCLEAIVCVANAWREGITPPPSISLERVPLRGFPHTPGQHNDLDDEEESADWTINFGTDAPEEDVELTEEDRARPPRVRQWMASLLDLSRKNPLLYVNPKSSLEFAVPPTLLGAIDDLLFTPRKRLGVISPAGLPREWLHEGASDGKFTTWINQNLKLVYPSHTNLNPVIREAQELVKLVRQEPGSMIPGKFLDRDRKRIEALRADPAIAGIPDSSLAQRLVTGNLDALQAELTKQLKKVDKQASDAMLMTGNNSLYLALGAVSWSESTSGRGGNKTSEWCAPLYLYPVILEGGKGSPFTIRLDPNGEPTPNYPLYEKLKRPPYNLSINELLNPPEDAKGIDFDGLIKAVGARLKQAHKSNFSVESRVFLGVFDYSTFRLWKDYKDSWKDMAAKSPVARHLMTTSRNQFAGNPETPDPRLEPYLPIPADDSQRQAVQWALDGKSFRLEGPPGTGKSQTIANLLASCIAHNKKVLFVAEKQTALNAVIERLEDAGLGKYCLNLHAKGDSDAKMRKKIADALVVALNEQVDPQDHTWSEIVHRLGNEEAALERYRMALHGAQVSGMTAWTANEQLLELGTGAEFDLPDGFVRDFEEKWPALLSTCAAIDTAMDLVNNPAVHPWRMASGCTVPETSFADITSVLTRILGALDAGTGGDQVSRLIDSFGPGGLHLALEATRLKASGMLPSSRFLEALVPAARPGSSADTRFDEFLTGCSDVAGAVAAHAATVSAAILGRDNLDEISRAADDAERSGSHPDLVLLETKWSAVVAGFDPLRGRIATLLLDARDRGSVVLALGALDDTAANQRLEEIVRRARALAAAARSHSANIRADFLGRADIVNVRYALDQATGAKALARRGRFKDLRDLLGADALTDNNDLLVLSLKEMLALADDAQRILLDVDTALPQGTSTGFRPWDPDSISALEASVRSRMVQALRAAMPEGLTPDSDDQFIDHVRRLIELAPAVDECRAIVARLLPAVTPSDFSPWIATDLDLVKSAVQEGAISRLKDLLGADALVRAADGTSRDHLLVPAVKAWLGARDRILHLSGTMLLDALPGYTRAFNVWDPAHVREMSDLRDALARLVDQLPDPALLADLKAITDNGGTDLAGALETFGSAWSEFTQTFSVKADGMSRWLGDRTLSTAIRQDFPVLLADGGPAHRYLELTRWLSLIEATDRLDVVGLGSKKNLLLSGETHIDSFASTARRSALSSAFGSLVAEGGLDRFDRKRHEQRIAAFEKASKDAMALLATRIPGLINRRIQAKQNAVGAQVGATAGLLQGLRPGRGERTPIRDLITKYGTALADAMPCFLMSPDSVAALVPVTAIDFDLVVFDEASQVRTSHAVGALGRGRAGIVVGDRQQMPPSSAFSSNTGAYDADEDQEDGQNQPAGTEGDDALDDEELTDAPHAARDSESILSEYFSCNFPHMQLLCHYRSRDEVLISFSNSNIYDEPMLTFPSTKGLGSDALRYVHVTDGQFERSRQAPAHVMPNSGAKVSALRTNIVEATRVVELVLKYLRDPARIKRLENDKEGKCESIIVVTFNSQQKTLIEEMLRDADEETYERATKEIPADDEAGTKKRPARLKIRNLESVQGDEAETVIFSVAFSKDLSGKKFPVNFGPVTQGGGERRLNVAVTRAQREMIVFASFLPHEMNVAGRTLSPEAQMVQRFLQLAHNGAGKVGDVGIPVPRSLHINRIAAEIRDLGYETHTQLGLSSLRVDIAVRRPGSETWELAVMVDDSCWSRRGSAYQREILPRQVLPGLGWRKVMRVWLPSWLDDREGILSDINDFFNGDDEPEEPEELSSIDDDAGAAATVQAAPSSAPVTAPPAASPAPFHHAGPAVAFDAFDEFDAGPMDLLDRASQEPQARAMLVGLINQVLHAEAPVEAERLGKIVCRCLNFGRISPDRVAQVLSFVPKSQITKDKIGRFVWHADQDPATWSQYRTSSGEADRKSHEIPVAEYTNALVDLVSKDPPIPRADAVRTVAAFFGFQKLARLIAANLETAVSAAIKAGAVCQVGEDLYPAD
jgi:hypothetical protein